MSDLDALLAQLARAAPAHPRAATLANASLAVGRFAARWAQLASYQGDALTYILCSTTLAAPTLGMRWLPPSTSGGTPT